MLNDVLNKIIVKAHDGIDLNCVVNRAENENAIIIIVHGLAEYLNRYDYVAEKFNDANLTVFRYDNRGHGLSGGERADLNDFNDFIKDADSIVEFVKKENPNIPVYMLGHSMGGFIAASYGINYKNKINGQILSAAAAAIPDQVKGIQGHAVKLINKILPTVKIKNNLGNVVSRDKEVVNNYKTDQNVLKKVTARFYYQFLLVGIPWLIGNLDKYEYPCLILHGGNDKIVNVNSSKNLFKKISSKEKKIKIYEGLYHEILNEKEKDIVIKDIISWIYSQV